MLQDKPECAVLHVCCHGNGGGLLFEHSSFEGGKGDFYAADTIRARWQRVGTKVGLLPVRCSRVCSCCNVMERVLLPQGPRS